MTQEDYAAVALFLLNIAQDPMYTPNKINPNTHEILTDPGLWIYPKAQLFHMNKRLGVYLEKMIDRPSVIEKATHQVEHTLNDMKVVNGGSLRRKQRGGAVGLLGASLSLLFSKITNALDQTKVAVINSTAENMLGYLATISSAMSAIAKFGETDDATTSTGFACFAAGCAVASSVVSAVKNAKRTTPLTPGQRIEKYIVNPVSYVGGPLPALKPVANAATGAWLVETARSVVVPKAPSVYNTMVP